MEEKIPTQVFFLREFLIRQCERPKDVTPEDEPSGQKVSYMLLGKSGGQLLIAPEGKK